MNPHPLPSLNPLMDDIPYHQISSNIARSGSVLCCVHRGARRSTSAALDTIADRAAGSARGEGYAAPTEHRDATTCNCGLCSQ